MKKNNAEFPQPFERFLKKSPLVLVDVGASGGIQEKWKRCAPFVRVIGFEPDDRSVGELHADTSADTSATFLSVGLHNKKASIPLYLTRTKTDTSMFEPDMAFVKKFPHADRFEVVATDMMQVDTLDSQLNGHKITDVDFIKVDTQGSELFILQGAASILDRAVFGVEVEVEFSSVYRNQPLFADVDAFMRSCGFQLFDLAPCFWKRKRGKDLGGERGQIIYANALYLKESKTFLASLDILLDNRARISKIVRAVSICLLHGYADYALEVADVAQHLFVHEEYKMLISDIIENTKPRSVIPYFPGKATMAALASRFAHILKPAPGNWKQFRDEVGN